MTNVGWAVQMAQWVNNLQCKRDLQNQCERKEKKKKNLVPMLVFLVPERQRVTVLGLTDQSAN